MQIVEAKTDSELQQAFHSEEMMAQLLETGYCKPISQITLMQRRGLAATLTSYHLYMKVKACMDQFSEGLELAGLGKYIKLYPDVLRPLFVDEGKPLTPGI